MHCTLHWVLARLESVYGEEGCGLGVSVLLSPRYRILRDASFLREGGGMFCVFGVSAWAGREGRKGGAGWFVEMCAGSFFFFFFFFSA